MKVCFETFGCRLNKAEALQMEADYIGKGWELTDHHADADLFVVRGCSVTSHAQHECEKLIAHLKKRYPRTPLRICGCLKPTGSISASQPPQSILRKFERSSGTSVVPTRTARAYLKVQDGCAGKCTYCIVPQFRGTPLSEDFSAIIDKAKRFVDAGYREIVVTGCNLSLYSSQGKHLPELLSSLATIDESCRIRLGSMEPGPCATDIVVAMSEQASVCKFLHLPIQSGAPTVLRRMNRTYTVRELDALIRKATDLMPNIGLGCDLITGFPGETELEFSATRGLLVRHPFSNVHVFPFSARPGTSASCMPGQIDPMIRSERARELSKLAEAKRSAYARSFLRKTVRIVSEKEGACIGWTDEYIRCEAAGAAPRKSLVRIRVTKADNGILTGIML